ncbi:MAG: hypothetical protein UW30_C0010G0025 [Candidatus Giovannonibacteria bacterium GW2011_GWA2_44_13b]|nr:MAG: hypothetical protein UW30_C0010G0025 [Candidatus Giovannonibacteria bacterium GW2011_GWA2_44_13b]
MLLVGIVGLVYAVAPFVYKQCNGGWQITVYEKLYNPLVITVIIIFGLILVFIAIWKTSRSIFRKVLIIFILLTILSSIFLASLNNVRIHTRDSRRAADLGQLRLANELYFSYFGQYIDKLEDLASKTNGEGPMIGETPKDPYTKQSYDYRLSADKKSFVLRSLMDGWDNNCNGKINGRARFLLNNSIDFDGQILGLSCDDPYYCIFVKAE